MGKERLEIAVVPLHTRCTLFSLQSLRLRLLILLNLKSEKQVRATAGLISDIQREVRVSRSPVVLIIFRVRVFFVLSSRSFFLLFVLALLYDHLLTPALLLALAYHRGCEDFTLACVAAISADHLKVLLGVLHSKTLIKHRRLTGLHPRVVEISRSAIVQPLLRPHVPNNLELLPEEGVFGLLLPVLQREGLVLGQESSESPYHAALARFLGADHRDREAEGLAQVDQGVGVGHFGREEGEKRGEILVDQLYALVGVVLGLSEEKLFWGEDRELALVEAVLLHVVLHFVHEDFIEVEELRVTLNDAILHTLLREKALVIAAHAGGLGRKLALNL